MRRKDWFTIDPTARLSWYEDRIGSLANYLELKDPFSEEITSHYEYYLQEINDQLNQDLRLSQSPLQTTDGKLEKYFELIPKLYTKLPTRDSNSYYWVTRLYQSLELITKAKIEIGK